MWTSFGRTGNFTEKIDKDFARWQHAHNRVVCIKHLLFCWCMSEEQYSNWCRKYFFGNHRNREFSYARGMMERRRLAESLLLSLLLVSIFRTPSCRLFWVWLLLCLYLPQKYVFCHVFVGLAGTTKQWDLSFLQFQCVKLPVLYWLYNGRNIFWYTFWIVLLLSFYQKLSETTSAANFLAVASRLFIGKDTVEMTSFAQNKIMYSFCASGQCLYHN